MKINAIRRNALGVLVAALGALLVTSSATAQEVKAPSGDETVLGELLITGTEEDQRPFLAVLPSYAPDLEDVIVRGVVRRDMELTGLYRVLDDKVAPNGSYGFHDPVDVKAWRAVGAQIIIKVAARKQTDGQIQVSGVAYLLSSGEQPVYQKTITVTQEDVRVTAHRVTDALLGALTGREGGFASHLTFASRWGKNQTIFAVDADGHNITRLTDPAGTAAAPAFGPSGYLFYVMSRNYGPFELMRLGERRPLTLPFTTSIYSVAFSKDGKQLAVSVAEGNGSSLYVGNADGTGMRKISGKSDIATHPVFSPSGKVAYIGGGTAHGSQRVYIDGKPVSPLGFSAASPDFCDTEDGVRLVYSVSIGGDKRDIVWSNENGKGIARLTQNEGSNSYPACSPDGRMLAYFSTRKGETGLYIKSLKSFTTQKISARSGTSMRWAALPPPGQGAKLVPEGQ